MTDWERIEYGLLSEERQMLNTYQQNVRALAKWCNDALSAIQSLPEDALGMGTASDGRYEWPFRDELISTGTAVLDPFREAAKKMAETTFTEVEEE